MRKTPFLLSVLLLSVSFSQAQSAEDSVKAAIGKLFVAMKNSDSRSILSVFADSAILQTIAKDKNGDGVIKTEKVPEFAKVISSIPKGAADEQISFEMVKVDGPLASAWTPYKFYFNGQFSHCGVNSFQMVRINGEWKIQYLVDTRRKLPCE